MARTIKEYKADIKNIIENPEAFADVEESISTYLESWREAYWQRFAMTAIIVECFRDKLVDKINARCPDEDPLDPSTFKIRLEFSSRYKYSFSIYLPTLYTFAVLSQHWAVISLYADDNSVMEDSMGDSSIWAAKFADEDITFGQSFKVAGKRLFNRILDAKLTYAF